MSKKIDIHCHTITRPIKDKISRAVAEIALEGDLMPGVHAGIYDFELVPEGEANT